MKIIGLMSGTSADGIDAALIEVSGDPLNLTWELLAFLEWPYPPSVRMDILNLCDPRTGHVDGICAMHAALGEWFADAALAVCDRAKISPDEVYAIGSHGQTIHHMPTETRAADKAVRSTLQIGDAAVIAERTSITTVSDFRTRDMAVGGQGAPLVPLVDFMLFRSRSAGRAMLNIGGIANVTVLPRDCQLADVFAFDTGPGNMIMDGVVHRATQGELFFDRDGQLAREGRVLSSFLEDCLRHPYFQMPPPKSTGREIFGQTMVDAFMNQSDSVEDLVATAANLTALSIADAMVRFVIPSGPIDELVVSGGGAKNPVLLELLRTELNVEVLTSDVLGLPSEAKEAVAFALLAHETVNRRPGNVPRVTGASKPVVLGSITPGHNRAAI
ncbi:MAG: anhydro-N-acetylmuramic acid kinase [bacterium]|nr:anhydro-N-acetylmuramic acid kinase [bacterium]